MQRYVAVVGGGDCSPEETLTAEQVGVLLARNGAVLVCGGLSGVMEAACRGARGEGGLTVGILPGNDRAAGNPFLSVAIASGLGELRNGLVVRASDALIAVGGEFGTLSEIALALKIGKPVVGIDTWELSKSGVVAREILRASSAKEAVQLALGLVGRPY
jgi:uncharacterized protein (TIGR00725 family)